eukprot:GHVU01073080.1.p1 GENE.GHVU01073080.1~~GHVU01073080.1.p1  ORF type:complete len:198 (-),score=16.14 GHVU01073080.1:147-740(-)
MTHTRYTHTHTHAAHTHICTNRAARTPIGKFGGPSPIRSNQCLPNSPLYLLQQQQQQHGVRACVRRGEPTTHLTWSLTHSLKQHLVMASHRHLACPFLECSMAFLNRGLPCFHIHHSSAQQQFPSHTNTNTAQPYCLRHPSLPYCYYCYYGGGGGGRSIEDTNRLKRVTDANEITAGGTAAAYLSISRPTQQLLLCS